MKHAPPGCFRCIGSQERSHARGASFRSCLPCGGRRASRAAVTLIELMVVLAIIGTLVSILIPAVQQAREAARQSHCLNNLHNLAVAAMNLEAAERHLPGPRMNALPTSANYKSDVGLFVTLLPFLEQSALFNRFDFSVPTNSLPNRELILNAPSFLKCPSAGELAKLHSVSSRFNGASTFGLDTETCDYAANDGYFIDYKAVPGTVRLRVDGLISETKLREVSDGLSNTLLLWESIGDKLRTQYGIMDTDSMAPASFQYTVGDSGITIQSLTQASFKSYALAWSGWRLGSVYFDDQRAINVTNMTGGPYTSHAGVLPCVFVDGSARKLSVTIDGSVMQAICTLNRGESANVEQ